jgi:predicted transcriptional regulator
MTTIELKNILIHKIAAINDESFLNALKAILDAKSEATSYITTEEQKEQIQRGINQMENGDSFANEQVESEIDQWLKEK